jgi:acetyl esterase
MNVDLSRRVTVVRVTERTEKSASSKIGRRRAAAVEGNREHYHDKRTEIVTSAVKLFRERGYKQTSLSDIAEDIGTERATLYYYFSSKEEILNEAVTPIVLRNTAVAEQLRQSDEPAPEKLRTLVRGLMASYAAHYPLLFLYLEEDLSRVGKAQQAWATEMRSVNRRYVGAIEAIIRDGIQAGTIRPLSDPAILANGVMGVVSWTHRWFNPDESSTTAVAIGEAYAELLVGGMAASIVSQETKDPSWRHTAHPDVLRVEAELQVAGALEYHTLSISDVRLSLSGIRRFQSSEVFVAFVQDLLVPGEAGQLPARLYHPEPGRKLPLLVYIHGGGWVGGGLDIADRPCRRLAVTADYAIVSIDYRRAPETKFPGPLNDCISAVRWLSANSQELGTDGTVVLMGDGAGGNLAAATTQRLCAEGDSAIRSQILLYPAMAPASLTRFSSYTRYAHGPLITKADADWFWDHYLPTDADRTHPAASPLLAKDLSGVARAMIVVAELDVLRDEGIAYAERLREADVEAELVIYQGAAHGFWSMDSEMQQAGELTDQIGRYLHAIRRTGL